MVGEKVAVVEKLHTASVCERENLDGQTDKHKIEIIFSVKDSWLSHIIVFQDIRDTISWGICKVYTSCGHVYTEYFFNIVFVWTK